VAVAFQGVSINTRRAEDVNKLLSIGATVALLAVPATASADTGNGEAHQDAVKTCKELRKAAGKKGFAELYGKKGLGRCIKQETKENSAEQQKAEETAKQNAAQQCKAERKADAAAFAEQYGSNKNGKNAFGKCVSQKAKPIKQEQQQQDEQEDEAQVNAAQECKAERKADPEGFAQTYGTNRNKRNAFGKCVSKKSQEAEEKPETEQQA